MTRARYGLLNQATSRLSDLDMLGFGCQPVS
jgi:hypothetical protein